MANPYWKSWYKKNKAHFLELVNKHKKARRKEFKILIDEKKDSPCVICKKKFPPEAIDLYHRDKGDKLFRISDASRLIYSIKKLTDELEKCDNYCAVCRRIVDTEELLANKEEATGKSALRRKLLREVVNEMKASPCADCGKVYPAYCMEFDHLGETPKEGTIAKMVSEGKPLEKIKAEIAKSEPICLNCHRVRTKTRNQY